MKRELFNIKVRYDEELTTENLSVQFKHDKNQKIVRIEETTDGYIKTTTRYTVEELCMIHSAMTDFLILNGLAYMSEVKQCLSEQKTDQSA
jgi:hypothetical protein